MSKSVLDYEMDWLRSQLGVSALPKDTIQDLRLKFYGGAISGSVFVGGSPARVARREADAIMLTPGGAISGGAVGSAVTDTTDYALGSSAAKVVTNGAGGYTSYTFPAIPSWDFTNAFLRLYVKLDSYTNTNFILIDVGGAAGFVDRFTLGLGEGSIRDSIRVFRENEWMVLDLPKYLFSVGAGAPAWNNITAVRVAATDKNSIATTFRVGGIAKVPNAAPLLPNGAVVLTFDDSYASHYTLAKPKMDSLGLPGVEYPIANGSALTISQLKTLRDTSGWEIGIHSMSSADHAEGFAGLTEEAAVAKFENLKSWANFNGFSSNIHAWPSGDSDAISEKVAKRYVSHARGTNAGVQSSGMANPYRLKTIFTNTPATLASLKARVDDAKTGKDIAIFMTHDIVASAPVGLQTLQSDFDALVDYIVAQGVPVYTMTGVLKKLQLL